MRFLIVLALLVVGLTACQPTTETPKITERIVEKVVPPKIDTTGFQIFASAEGDTTYIMKKYFMVHLKPGPNRDQDKETAVEIQKAHRAHLSKMAEARHICIVGPSDGDPDILGIAIYSTTTLELADSLANADPAVQAGRLTVEIFPFWAAAGSYLF